MSCGCWRRAKQQPCFFGASQSVPDRYLQIVHSVREGKKVRQQVIATLGRLDLLEASGQLERLMRSGLRHCESFAVIDAHAAGEIEPVAIRRIGPDLVFARLWKESGIAEVLRSVLKTRQYEFDVERAIYLTVLHRLFASGSDRAAERWREDYLIPGTEGLELHHLYRAMAFLGDAIERAREADQSGSLQQRPHRGGALRAPAGSIYRSGVGLFRHHFALL